jgi:hypothetical protein
MPNQQRKYGTIIIGQEDDTFVCQFTRSNANATTEPFATVRFLNLSALIQKNRERIKKALKEKSKFKACVIET